MASEGNLFAFDLPGKQTINVHLNNYKHKSYVHASIVSFSCSPFAELEKGKLNSQSVI